MSLIPPNELIKVLKKRKYLLSTTSYQQIQSKQLSPILTKIKKLFIPLQSAHDIDPYILIMSSFQNEQWKNWYRFFRILWNKSSHHPLQLTVSWHEIQSLPSTQHQTVILKN